MQFSFARERWLNRLALVLLALVVSGGARIHGADLPDKNSLHRGAEAVIDLLRSAPTDRTRLERVARWAEEHGGIAPLAVALEARGVSKKDPLDLFLAGLLQEEAGQASDAVDPYERALAIDSQSPARDRLIELWLRSGWGDRAAALAKEASSLPLETRVRVLAAGVAMERETARAMIRTSELSLDDKIALASRCRFLGLVAELAEGAGRWDLACEANVEAGNRDAAIALLERGSDPSAETRLALARLSGDPKYLGPEPPEQSRWLLGQSLGEIQLVRPRSAEDFDPPEREEIRGTTVRNPRRDAAIAVIAGEAPADVVAELSEGGAPSLAVATAWLALGDTDAARREVARWRLNPRPGETQWRTALERKRPQWWGLEPPPTEVLKTLEGTRTGDDELRRQVDHALLACIPGTGTEAEILFHRARLFSTDDAARAFAIAPGRLVRFPIEKGYHLVAPLTREGVTTPSPFVLSAEFDAAIPGAPAGQTNTRNLSLWPPSRPPQPIERTSHIHYWNIQSRCGAYSWNEFGFAPPRVYALNEHPLAPVTAWVRVQDRICLVGRGLAIHDASGALEVAIATEEPVNVTDVPGELLQFLTPSLSAFFESMKSPRQVQLSEIPGAEDAWHRALLREELPPETVPEAIYGCTGDDPREPYLIIVGNGITLHLEAGPARRRGEAFEGLTREGKLWKTRTPQGLADAPATTQVPRAPLRIVKREFVEPSSRGAEQIRPFFEESPFDITVTPTMKTRRGRSGERIPHDRFDLNVKQSGWVTCEVEGLLQWKGIIPPLLPGPQGWRFRRPEPPPDSRRGPDLTGPTSTAGTMSSRRLPNDTMAILTDRVHLFDPRGVVAIPEGPLTEAFSVIRDVSIDGSDLVVLPAPGDHLVTADGPLALGREGGFDIEQIEGATWVLSYDPLAVALVLSKVTREDISEIPLPPEIVIEEDRENQRPVALGRWGSSILIAYRGRLWSRVDDEWISLLPERDSWPMLPAHAWQSPPRIFGDGGMVAWPWGEIEEFRAL